MKIIIFILMFLCIGAFFIISQNEIPLNNSENIDKFLLLYKDWVGDIFGNLGSMAGHIVKMEWLPE